jgi:hypothetical protein
MKLGQLRKVLKTAESHYRSDGRGDLADLLSTFTTNLLKGNDSQTVAAFVSGIQKARKSVVARTTARSGRER